MLELKKKTIKICYPYSTQQNIRDLRNRSSTLYLLAVLKWSVFVLQLPYPPKYLQAINFKCQKEIRYNLTETNNFS